MHRITTFFIFSSSVGSELKNILLLIMSTIYTNIYNIYKYLQYIQISTIYRVSQKNFLLSKLARANFTVDNEKSIEKGDNGTVVAYPALRQTCNPPGFGFCSLFGRLG